MRTFRSRQRDSDKWETRHLREVSSVGERSNLTLVITSPDFYGAYAPYRRQRIIILMADLDVRVSTEDGELIRHLTLSPSKNYQPRKDD